MHQPSVTEHPFARFVRILGKGPNLSRSLTMEEAEEAARMLMDREALPEQVGAFFCLLRIKSETPEEVAGLVRGFRSSLAVPEQAPVVDLDWASWAGKARQLPWYLLAALALARSGIRIFMHGAEDHTPGRIYTSQSLAALGMAACGSVEEAARSLREQNFAYLTLDRISPRLQELMDLRSVLGIRSPLHTVGRKLNLFNAAAQVVAVTHPPYLPVHQQASALLQQPAMAVFKGDGGEVERRPGKPCVVHLVQDGQCQEETWPPLPEEPVQARDEGMDLQRLAAVWNGVEQDARAEAAITGTMAIVLKLLGKAGGQEEAWQLAREIWGRRSETGVATA